MSHGSGLVRTTCSSGGAPGPGQPSEGLLDPVYPRTQGALFKVAQMVTLLIAFICVRSSLPIDYGAHSFFEVVTMCDLIMILIFYLVHLFRFYRVLTCISWPLSHPVSPVWLLLAQPSSLLLWPQSSEGGLSPSLSSSVQRPASSAAERALAPPTPSLFSPRLQELLHYLIGTLLLLIASIVIASKSYNQSGLVAGAIFGFLASFLCLASLWLSYNITCVTQSSDASA